MLSTRIAKASLLTLGLIAAGVSTVSAGRDPVTGELFYDEEDSKYANLLAAASYCPEASVIEFTCNVCEDDRLAKFEVYTQLRNDQFNVFGFTGVDKDRKTVHITFRGTELYDVRNVALDFVKVQVPFVGDPSAQVEAGWQEMYKTIRDQVIQSTEELTQLYPPGEYRYVVTGHSLGGAMTYLGTMDVAQFVGPEDLTAYPSAAPCIGDTKFQQIFNAAAPDTWRVAAGDDPTPVCLTDISVHAGFEVYYQPWDAPAYVCTGLQDPFCMNANQRPPNFVDHARYMDEFIGFCRREGPPGEFFGSGSSVEFDMVSYAQQVIASYTDDILFYLGGGGSRDGWYYTNPITGKHTAMFPARSIGTGTTTTTTTTPVININASANTNTATNTNTPPASSEEGLSPAAIGGVTVGACAMIVGAGVYAVKTMQGGKKAAVNAVDLAKMQQAQSV